MTQVKDLHKKWMKNPKYKSEYDKLTPEFELARAIIDVRTKAGLTQAQLAKRMKTTQSVVARLEGGRVNASTETLSRIAKATGSHLTIDFDFAGVS